MKTKLLLLLTLLVSTFSWGQLFQQDFSSSTTLSTYVSATPNNGQFDAISTSGAGTVLSIDNGGGNNKLRFARTNNAGSYTRITDFSPLPTSLIYKFDLTVSGNSVAQTGAAYFYVGDNFAVANTNPANADIHSRFAINFTTTNGTFQFRRNESTATNSSNVSGTVNVTWVINNSGTSLNYTAPDGTTESIANDTWDLWAGTTKIFNDIAALTATKTLADIKFLFNQGTGTIDIDNININPIPTCTDPGLAFVTTSVIKNDTDPNFTETATSSSAGAITYSSSDTGVATVNSTTGQVTIVGPGTATITASQVANSTYCADTATYTLTVNNTSPFIAPATTAITAMTTTYGTASANQCFTFTAGNLTGSSVTVTAPSGFLIATSSGGTYAASQTYTVTSGSASGTVCVLLANNTAAGTHSGIINFSDGTTTATKAIPNSTVNPKGLTITGLSATTKEYDGNTSVVIAGTATYSGLVLGETFAVTGSVTWAFSSKNVGATVVRTGNYNAPSTNYTVTQPTLTANITPKALTVSGATAQNKPYDGTTTATITGATLVGVISPDVVTVSGGGTFASANVGTGISVTANLTLAGADSGNYTVTQPTGLNANITAIAPTINTTAIGITTGGTYTLPGSITSNSAGAFSYSLGSVSPAGSVTLTGTTLNGIAPGTAILTVTQAANGNYTAGSTTVTVNVTTCSPPLWEENFDYGGCDIEDISTNTAFMSNWAFQSDGADPFKYNTVGLSYSGYASSGSGGSGQFQGGADDDFRREVSGTSGISSGNLYASFMLNITGAGTSDYFLSFMDNNTTPAFYGLVQMRSSGAGYQLGIRKSPTGTITWNTPVLSFNSTYLIVIKNEFVSGSTNDVFKMWIIPSGVPASEALAGAPTITAVTADTDPNTSIRYFAIRETGKEVGFVDGIRVATSWESLFCGTTPTATTYTWTGASSSSWANAGNWSPSGVPSSIDNIIISSTGTNMLNITDCRAVKDFTLSGTGAFTASATGVFTIYGNVSYSSSVSSTLDCNSQVFIKSAASQLIPPLTYGNLDVLGGNRVFSPTGIIKICSGFNVVPDPSTSIYTVTGSTVEYTSPASGWVMTPFTYNNLTFSGSGDFSIGYSSPAVNKTVNVLGNFSQTAGILYLGETTTATATLNVEGNMTISGGTFEMNATNGGRGIVNLKGDLTISSLGNLSATSTTLTNTNFNFTGTGNGTNDALTQTIDIGNNSTTQRISFNVNSGAYTKLINQDFALGTNSTFTVKTGGTFDFGFKNFTDPNADTSLSLTRVSSQTGQKFELQDGGTLKITSPYGINIGGDYTGNAKIGSNTTNRIFSLNAIYHYIGREYNEFGFEFDQVSGVGLPGTTGNKTVIVELENNDIFFRATGIKWFNTGYGLEIRRGIVVDDNTNRFDNDGQSGTLKMTGGTYKILTSGADFSSATYTQPGLSGNYDLSTGSKIIFAHTSATTTVQGIRGGSSYQYPEIQVTGEDVYHSSSGNINMKSNGLFTVKENAILTGTGTNAQIVSLNDINPATVTIENNGRFKTEREKGFSGTPDGINPAPSVRTGHTTGNVLVTLQPGSIVEYSRAGDQTITHTNFSATSTPYSYQNLHISGSGNKTLQHNTATRVNENLEVLAGNTATLLVETGKVITVKQAVKLPNTAGDAKLEIKNNGQLIQIDDLPLANTGTNFIMERIAKVNREDYVYWSSPSDAFTTATIPSTGSRFEWNPLKVNSNGTQGNWVTPTTTMTKGKGYIAKVPNSAPLRPATAGDLTTNFAGKPFNGTVSVDIFRGSRTTAGTNVTEFDDNWNLLGNPYPSAIDALEFLQTNGGNLFDTNPPATPPTIVGAVWVWRHGQSPTNSTDPFYNNFANNYYSSDYIKYNGTGSTPPGFFDGKIAAGQGFMICMKDNVSDTPYDFTPTPTNPIHLGHKNTVVFNNSMRFDDSEVHYNNNQFFRTANAENSVANNDEKHRIWLDIIKTSNGQTDTALIGYVSNATMGEDNLYDTFFTPRNEVSLYSLINTKSYIIQGRSLPFDTTDLVPLGMKIISAGNHTIAIRQVDGIFEGNQNIYLEDKQLNIIHDLKQSPYHFTAPTGINNTRFVLRYTTNALGNADFDYDNQVVVFSKNNTVTINSSIQNIAEVQVYDVLGRQLYQNTAVENQEHSFAKDIAQQTIIVKVKLLNGIWVTKKVLVK